VEVQFHAFLTSVLDGGVVSFNSEERAPDMRLTGGWMVEPRSGLVAVDGGAKIWFGCSGEEKDLSLQGIKPEFPGRPITIWIKLP
jgi:hypothetical protein